LAGGINVCNGRDCIYFGVNMSDWTGKRVLIMGAARQGQALTRFLCARGAFVVLNDYQVEEKLSSAKAALQDLNIQWVTGGHPLSILDGIDLVCLSGGVPLSNPIAVEANLRGIGISNDTQIFMEEVPCKVIGITGSAGKTTTTTLIGRIAKEGISAPNKVWVGGNIGNPLISNVDQMNKNDLVIMEISSFQLEQMTISPNIAVILNITPNHLDRHGTMEAYTEAKSRILAFQKNEDYAILNRDDDGSRNLANLCKGHIITFGLKGGDDLVPSTFVQAHQVCYSAAGLIIPLLDVSDIQLRGEHNLMNVLAACAISCAAGFSAEAIQKGLADFSGVPHRLQFVREHNGTRWYNDSIATAPERTMAALRSFSEPIILLAGGRDKDLPWEDFATLAHERVSHLILFGEAANKIYGAISAYHQQSSIITIDKCSTMEEGLEKAMEYAKPGFVVLLSPGGTSFDQFKDFEQRGEAFIQWVQLLS
jgi:UDP-N-acetylmuramoylalanine--D-glutamate ligase